MIKKLLFLYTISLLTLVSAELSGQSNPIKIKKREFKKQEYGFIDAWHSIKDANKYYSMGLGSYRDAREKYLAAYSYNPDNAELNYMIGKCYLYSDNKLESIKYIEKAFKIKPDVQFDIHLMLGMAYHQILEFDKAIEEYNYFITILRPKFKTDYQSKVDQLIQECKNGKLLVAEPKRAVINNIGKGVNSIFDEYRPCITKDGKSMYFTSRRKFSKRSEKSIIDNKYFEDGYYSELVNNVWTRAKRLDKKVTDKDNTSNIAVVGLSPDNQNLYIYKGKEKNGNLYACTLKNDEWSKPSKIRKINTKHRETSMCMSSDGSTLYFISSGRKDGYGEGDIYVSHKNESGIWERPENIGNVVNTYNDELGVSLGANDSVLYFGSKGHNSMGGYDVFRSTLTNVGLWSKPENLGYPINTPNDDLFYYEMPGGKIAYYSANRENGLGGMDIYKIIYLGPEKKMQPVDVDDLIIGAKAPYDDIYFVPTLKVTTDSAIQMRGFINDSEDKKPIVAKIELIDREKSVVAATGISDSTGNYSLSVPQAKNYGVEILAKGYLLYLDLVDLSTRTFDEVVVKNFLLDRVEVGAKVVLNNIYFEFGKTTLKKTSYIGLDNVVKLMESNETVRIEISGHTDNVGGLQANTKLSTGRAKAVADYLIKKGINKSRVTYKGYAYNQPVASNKTAKGRAQNRRVEFKVLSK
jgi:outer membrane protein OmpA-like peptidoglycan-associated protein/tetratricopeptide (TPR) repeat protein